VILGLKIVFDPLDAERGKIVAQARQGAFVEKSGQVIGCVRQQLAAPETDEQIEIFALDLECGRYRRSLCKSCVGAAKWRHITVQLRDLLEQCGRRRGREQRREQRVFLGAPRVDRINRVVRRSRPAIEIRTKLFAGYARRGFHRNHTLRRHPVPVRHGGLGNAYFSGKLGNAARRINGTFKACIAHAALPSKGPSVQLRLLKGRLGACRGGVNRSA